MATPLLTETAPQPEIGLPPILKATVPVGACCALVPVKVAVKVTDTPVRAGFAVEVSVTDGVIPTSVPCIASVAVSGVALVVSVTFSHRYVGFAVSEEKSGSKSISRLQLAPAASGVLVVQRLVKAVPVCTN